MRSQPPDIKHELQSFVCPLICHLFVELLKGKDPQPAHNFLRKFAHLVGPVQSVPTQPVLQPPQPHTNGNGTASKSTNGTYASASASTYGGLTFRPITYMPEPENAGTVHKHFMALVEALSVCQRPEDVDTAEVTRLFRYAQQEMPVHGDTVVALKRHLISSGHVMILHTLQTWFALDIADEAVGTDGEWLNVDELELVAAVGNSSARNETNPAESIAATAATSANISNTKRAKLNTKINAEDEATAIHRADDQVDLLHRIQKLRPSNSTKTKEAGLLLQHLRWSVQQVRTYERPMRVMSINNAAGQ